MNNKNTAPKSIDLSKITEKELIVLRFKITGKPMKLFYDDVGRASGISEAYGNKLFIKLRKKCGELNSSQLISSAYSLGILDK